VLRKCIKADRKHCAKISISKNIKAKQERRTTKGQDLIENEKKSGEGKKQRLERKQIEQRRRQSKNRSFLTKTTQNVAKNIRG
jgi:hypothetical protein